MDWNKRNLCYVKMDKKAWLRIFVVTAVLLFFYAGLHAQFNFDFADVKGKYSKYNAIMIEKGVEVTIDLMDDSISASQKTREQILILNNYSKAYSNDRIIISGFTKINNIIAQTYIPTKRGKYKSIRVTQFNETDDLYGNVFYDDSKSLSFTFPAVQEGAVTSLEYTTEFLDSRFLKSFLFKSYIPVLHTSLILKVNKNVSIEHKGFNLNGLDFDFKKYEKGNYDYYVWNAQDLEEYEMGSGRVGIMHYSPHIVYYVSDVNINNISKKHYGSVVDLYRFYMSFTENVDTSCDENLKRKVDELIKGFTSEEDKVKTILYWVRENIKYIAFEQGMRGFIPDGGGHVYAKKYGDCKDMASLIVTMLNCAGIKAHLAWTGTRHIPYSYHDLPLPKTDNHMVAVCYLDGKPVILDGTINHLTFGYPPYLLLEKELLISLNRNDYSVYKVPVPSAEESLAKSRYHIKILGDTIIGSGNTSFAGYHRTDILNELSGLEDNDLKNVLMEILKVGSNKFNITEYNVDIPQMERRPVNLEFDFSVQGYVKSFEDELYINMSIDKSYGDFMLDASFNNVPIENDYYFHEAYETVLELPKGYSVDYIPSDKKFDNDRYHFSISYKKDEDKIVQRKDIYFKFLILQKKEFETWNRMIDELEDAYRETIVLKKNSF